MTFGRAKLPLLLLIVPLAVLSGGKAVHRHLPSDAYVWQRRWTPAVAQALEQSRSEIRAWLVLVVEADVRGKWSLASVDWTTLRRSNRPVIFVTIQECVGLME